MKFLASLKSAASRAHKLVRDVLWVGRNMSDPSNPLRHVYGWYKKAGRPREVLQRKLQARRFTANLDPEVAKAAQDFEREGMVNVDHLIDPQLLQELAEYFATVVVERRERISPLKRRAFFTLLHTEEDDARDGVPVRFALQRKIVQLATAYTGKVPFLRSVSFLESNGIEQEKWEQSQLWHLDFYYTYRMPALWVYLTDVQETAHGPFTYLPAAASRRVKYSFMPRRVLDEEIEASGLAGEIKQIKGPRLTCFMVDNNRIYHLGSRMGKGERRSVFMTHYVDPVGEKDWIKGSPLSEDDKLLVSRG